MKLVNQPLKLILSILLLVIVSTFGFGQTKKVAYAEKYFNAYRYQEASEIYLELINKAIELSNTTNQTSLDAV